MQINWFFIIHLSYIIHRLFIVLFVASSLLICFVLKVGISTIYKKKIKTIQYSGILTYEFNSFLACMSNCTYLKAIFQSGQICDSLYLKAKYRSLGGSYLKTLVYRGVPLYFIFVNK